MLHSSVIKSQTVPPTAETPPPPHTPNRLFPGGAAAGKWHCPFWQQQHHEVAAYSVWKNNINTSVKQVYSKAHKHSQALETSPGKNRNSTGSFPSRSLLIRWGGGGEDAQWIKLERLSSKERMEQNIEVRAETVFFQTGPSDCSLGTAESYCYNTSRLHNVLQKSQR